MKSTLLFVLGVLLFSTSALADRNAISHSIILVYDNSIMALPTGFKKEDHDGKPLEYQNLMRSALTKHFSQRNFHQAQLSIVTVDRPKVIWEGRATRASLRKHNKALMNFVKTTPSGCADFSSVTRMIARAARTSDYPVKEVIFLSPLLHSGKLVPHPTIPGKVTCERPNEDFAPPKDFFDWLAELQRNTDVELIFWGLDDDVAHTLADEFDSRDVSYKDFSLIRTRQELR